MPPLDRREFSTLATAAALSASMRGSTHSATGGDIAPFSIAVAESALSDLKERLGAARWPQCVATDWSRGQPTPFVEELADRWQGQLYRRKHQAQLNAYPQFTAQIAR